MTSQLTKSPLPQELLAGVRITTLVAVPLIAVGVVGVCLLAQEPRIHYALRSVDAGKVVAALARDLAEAFLRTDAAALAA